MVQRKIKRTTMVRHPCLLQLPQAILRLSASWSKLVQPKIRQKTMVHRPYLLQLSKAFSILLDIVRFLVEAGAAKKGATPLMAAVQEGNLDIIRLLMESGAVCRLFCVLRKCDAANLASQRTAIWARWFASWLTSGLCRPPKSDELVTEDHLRKCWAFCREKPALQECSPEVNWSDRLNNKRCVKKTHKNAVWGLYMGMIWYDLWWCTPWVGI